MDRISNLPNNVLELILDKLSVVDQVTTSALSRNWRFKWTLVPSLELHHAFIDCCLYNYGARDPITVIECVNIINGLLLQHGGRLRTFGLTIPSAADPINPALFDNPIRFVSRIPGLERLTIKNVGLLSDGYTLPYSVFCAVGLTHLSLSHCQLCPPPSFGGLPNLVSLYLGSCTCTANVITWILSVCPQLQELKLAGLRFKNQTLHISAPKLRYLSIYGSLWNIYLEKAEDLEKVDVGIYDLPGVVAVGPAACTFQVFSHPCSKLCEITISNNVCKLLTCRGALQTLPVFDRLKELIFSDVDLDNLDVFRCVLSFLVHSPNLKALTMIVNSELDEMDLFVDISEYESMVKEYVVGTNFGHLKEVFVKRFEGTSLQMNMIKLLLGISPVLEKMHIKLCRKHPLSLEKERKILRKMLSFSRASGKAKIKIK